MVVLLQPPAYFAGLDPNHGVFSGGIPGWTMKDLHPNGALLQEVVLPA
jgi:hypothetical protein